LSTWTRPELGSEKCERIDKPPIDTPGSSSSGEMMDHKEEHHQHHRKEREHEKKEKKEYEHQQEKSMLPFHPAWLVALGIALVVAAVLVWTFIL
jgi:hypothetical protein